MENTTAEGDQEFIGHAAAAEYIGIDVKTLSGYTARGTGPVIFDRRVVDNYVRPIFLKSDIDSWQENRPGQGRRTDLIKVGDSEDVVVSAE